MKYKVIIATSLMGLRLEDAIESRLNEQAIFGWRLDMLEIVSPSEALIVMSKVETNKLPRIT